MILPRSLPRIACVCLLALLATGCGIKTAYNNLDRLILWSSNDYVDFDKRQMAFLRAELDVLLYWHRRTQLPLYAEGLRTFERDVRKGLDRESLLVMESRVRSWGEALVGASMPLFGELLFSLSDAQITELQAGFEASNAEWLEPYEGLDAERRKAEWSKEFGDGFENFAGRLNRDQKAIIDRYRGRYRPDDAAWLGYRERWQAAVVALIRERKSYEQFELEFRELAFNRERWYGDDYRALFEHNESMYRDLSLELLGSLDAKQMSRFSDRLLGVAEDFEELAVDRRIEEPREACLVTCGPLGTEAIAR